MSLDPQRVADLVEIHELCSRYMAYASQYLVDQWLELFTPDGEYSAFGTKYPVDKMAELLAAAPRGQFIGTGFMPKTVSISSSKPSGSIDGRSILLIKVNTGIPR